MPVKKPLVANPDLLIVEPWYGGSHRQWIDAYQQRSTLNVQTLALPARYWKWRMMGGAQSLARQFRELRLQPRRILASSMLDLPTFLGLLRREVADIPVDLYLHENQILYPWSPSDPTRAKGSATPGNTPHRDNLYAYRNLISAIAADRVFFNSGWHRRAFLDALPEFLDQFPDRRERQALPDLRKKSKALYLGLDLQAIDHALTQQPARSRTDDKAPVLVWNHRWEHDKNPALFFETLVALKADHAFQVLVLGQNFGDRDGLFAWAQEALHDRILHWGPVEDRQEYLQWLIQGDILPVTAHHDFFGVASVEALYAGCRPVLPNHWVYPDLLPETARHRYLYEADQDVRAHNFKEALLLALRDWPQHDPAPFRQRLGRFDWSVMAPVYDRVFSEGF
ncbi:MAG: DUF3524 domain-containing protein [Bacteroidetes bacterium]|nr:DUF3524 domain-containing protein [Bacteroidota bacterium]